MATEVIFICLFFFITPTLSERMELSNPNNASGICKGTICRNQEDLSTLKGCVVIVGSLQLLIERSKLKNEAYDIREITEFLVIYRVNDLTSVGNLFPNLTRIRGVRLLNNYALVVYENMNLTEIGLYNLVKIDRGGVIAWQLPQACYVDTVDWQTLAPNARHVIEANDQIQCNVDCRCSTLTGRNHCWNHKVCQKFIEGPEAFNCSDLCIGCRLTRPKTCQVCRHFTYRGECLLKCPSHTIVQPDSQYCITEHTCSELNMLVFNNTCVAHCPIGFVEKTYNENITCERCTDCQTTCGTLVIQSIGSIEAAERCVYIKGNLRIHLRAVLGATASLKKYLSHIEEVSEYIEIESSDALTSLEFLPSLRKIKGEKLKEDKYSLDIVDNPNLQTLFTLNATKNLVIDKGVVRFENNQKLCISEIEKAKKMWANKSKLEFEVPEGKNGYNGGCKEVTFKIGIRKYKDPTVVKVEFSPIDPKAHYSVLYTRLPPGVHNMDGLPETCSEYEWLSSDVLTEMDQYTGIVNLTSLRPASTYFLCIELYDPVKKILARSNLSNFTTPVGIPEPPFIVELIAIFPDTIYIHWVNHKDYKNSITHYELDVSLIEAKKHIVDYCNLKDYIDEDYDRHAFVRKPPPNYGKGCESMCGILSSLTKGALEEENFEICDGKNIKCDNEESNKVSQNSSYASFVRTLVLKIENGLAMNYQVSGLAPFSDYKFRLRACSGTRCSRSARGVVRTLESKTADVPGVTDATANQSGYITIKWEPPKITNGPILFYSVQVFPIINARNLMPQTWCAVENQRSLVVKSVITSAYKVRVCAKTLVSIQSCNEWVDVTPIDENGRVSWWMVVVCGLMIFIASSLIGWYCNVHPQVIDVIPLVDSTSSNRVESEPPIEMFSDFVPLYSRQFE